MAARARLPAQGTEALKGALKAFAIMTLAAFGVGMVWSGTHSYSGEAEIGLGVFLLLGAWFLYRAWFLRTAP